MQIEYLENWNPWWTTKEVPAAMRGIPRTINPLISKAMPEREIIALTGVRRGGKTTIMYQMINSLLKEHRPEQIIYVNLDDDALQRETIDSIFSCYLQHKNPDGPAFVFLDEIQNMAGWERFLKKHYDMRENVKFVVSGSCAGLLKGEFSTLLTGRNLTFTIYPLSFREFLEFTGIEYRGAASRTKDIVLHELMRYLEIGGFPEVHLKDKALRSMLLRQYLDDIIYKDIVKRHNINAKKVTDLAVYLLTNIANPYTIRKIRNFTGLSIDSIKDYESYLEDAWLISPLDHFSYSMKERTQLPRKSFALDCGLRNIACFRFSGDAGRLAENCVRAELLRRGKDAYYWKGRKETDFVVKNPDNSLTAINISFTDKPDEREMEGLREFKEKHRKAKELILLTRDREERIGDIRLIPLWKWLLG